MPAASANHPTVIISAIGQPTLCPFARSAGLGQRSAMAVDRRARRRRAGGVALSGEHLARCIHE